MVIAGLLVPGRLTSEDHGGSDASLCGLVSIRIDGASSDIRGAAGTGHHSYHPNKRGELGSELRLHGGRDGDGLRAMEEWLSEC
jgi:hypothetical protein